MGGPRRSVRLRVIGGSVELRNDVPATRADCPVARPCPHVRCEHHLWMIDGRDRPGRRRPGRRLPSSELRPVWLEWPLPLSCGADLLENAAIHGWSREQKAKALGLTLAAYHRTLCMVTRRLRELGLRGETILDEFLTGARDAVQMGLGEGNRWVKTGRGAY